MVLSQLPAYEASIVAPLFRLVSGRRSVHQSIGYFLQQDWRHKELNVLEQGMNRFTDLICVEVVCPGSNRRPQQLCEMQILCAWLTSHACEYNQS